MNAKEKLINEIQGSENYVGAANDISAKDQLRTSGWIAGNFIIRPASKGAPHDFTLGFIDQSHAYRKVRIYLTHHVNNDFAYLAFTPIASERERFQTFANLTTGVSEIRGRDEIRALTNATAGAGEAKVDTNIDFQTKTARLFKPSRETQAGAAAAPNPAQNQSTNELK